MSCWVVPSLAAELWQIPLEQVLKRIRDGEITVRVEDGFLFVDVAPYGPRIERPIVLKGERPPTFTPAEDAGASISEEELIVLEAQTSVEVEEEDELGAVDETESKVLGDWRGARKKAARQRIPPPPRRLSA
jgi:hypothetical protein